MTSIPPCPAPLLVIDGDAPMHRAYHALPPIAGAGGRPTMELDAPVDPPLDAVPDWLAGAAAARERGMDALAGRLEARAEEPTAR